MRFGMVLHKSRDIRRQSSQREKDNDVNSAVNRGSLDLFVGNISNACGVLTLFKTLHTCAGSSCLVEVTVCLLLRG